jgi:hypothetical protein
VKQELVELSDEIWTRLRSRLQGLTDLEYLWEPAPGTWTIRERGGRWRHDWTLPPPDPAPITSIAWRIWHLIDLYGEQRAPRWLDVPPQGAPIGLDDPGGSPPRTAGAALDLLDAAHRRWDAHLGLVTEDSLRATVGPVGGGYADRTRAAYVLHMLDEFAHHGAEVSLLRDLWRWAHPLGVDPLTERAMLGDVSLRDLVVDLDPSAGSELMRTAAAYARWELVAALLEVGVEVPSEGRTPLHSAAGAGELELVQRLVAAGASVAVRDPEFHASPLEWARFLGHDHVVAWFEERTDR